MWNYAPPSKIDRATGINLRNIRNNDNQTAYDRWLEIKTEVKFNSKGGIVKNPKTFTGKTYDLQQTVERLIANKRSQFYSLPTGTVNAVDYKAQMITKIVREVEKVAYWKMVDEFPDIKTRIELQDKYSKESFKEAKTSYLENLLN
jgi:hypothetical protein